MPILRQIASAVALLSPVIIITRIPASRQSWIAWYTSVRGGSSIPTMPTNVIPLYKEVTVQPMQHVKPNHNNLLFNTVDIQRNPPRIGKICWNRWGPFDWDSLECRSYRGPGNEECPDQFRTPSLIFVSPLWSLESSRAVVYRRGHMYTVQGLLIQTFTVHFSM